MRSMAVLILVLAACSSPVAPPDAIDEAPDAVAFDLALVQSNFTDECADPTIFDDLLCQQVDIDGMTADGSILTVPTTLSAVGDMGPRAEVICELIAFMHFDGATGDDLGYDTIGILDREGDNLTACTVAP